MDDIAAGLSPEQLEIEFPLLGNLRGETFSYLDLGEAIFCDDEGVGSAAVAMGFSGQDRGISGRRRLWGAFTAEFFTMLCSDGDEYEDFRRQVAALKGQPTTVIVGTISSAVGAGLGIEAGLLTPFVVLLLHGVVSLGRNSMCSEFRHRSGSNDI
jgi:hypothetical protein